MVEVRADTLRKFFGQNLKHMRLKRRYTQADLGKEIGRRLERSPVAGTTIGNWERGETSPDILEAAAIAATLGTTTEWLLTGRTGTAQLGDSAAEARLARLEEAVAKIATAVGLGDKISADMARDQEERPELEALRQLGKEYLE